MVFIAMDFIPLKLMMRTAPLMPVQVTGLPSHVLVCIGSDIYTVIRSVLFCYTEMFM